MDRKQLAIDFAKSLNYPEIEKIILYGSVARGKDHGKSDILDILIITSKEEDELKIEDEIYTKVFDILMTLGEKISITMRSISHYNNHLNFSFYKNVERDRIIIS